MNVWVIVVGAISLLFGAYRLRQDLRDFFGAIFVSLGGLIGLGWLIIKFLEWTGKYSIIWPILLSYGGGSLIIIGTIWLLIKNTSVMESKEGRSTAGKLSLVMGVNLIFILVVSIFLYQFRGIDALHHINVILMTILMIDLTFTLLFLCYLLYSLFYQMVPIKEHMNYIIVLGAGIRSEEVTPLLRSRLDKGIRYYKKNNGVKMIVSGGKGPDEPISEAAAMKRYLLSQGIPEHDIIEENQSKTTYENMLFSKKIIEMREGDKDYSVMFTTNNYHVFRAAMYARRAGLKADGVGSPTALYFLPTAMMREFIGILSRQKVLVALICLFWIAVGWYNF